MGQWVRESRSSRSAMACLIHSGRDTWPNAAAASTRASTSGGRPKLVHPPRPNAEQKQGEGLPPSPFRDTVLYMEHEPTTREAIAAEVRASLARSAQSALWLAERSGISKTSLSLKLKGQRSFSVEELLAVADALGIDAGALLPRAVAA